MAAAAAALRISALGLASLRGARGYRAAQCTELAKPLILQDLPAPPLQPHQVRVGVQYCGLNFADILACQGLYQDRHTPPFTPGMEFSGTVMETGENVSAVKEGYRVIGVTGTKAMAAECVVDEKMLWQIPDSVSHEDAAVLPIAYGTAWLALCRRARLQPGETVLVTAGAGATGLAIIDLAANVFQAKVIAAAGSDPKCELAVTRGASHGVNYSRGSLREEVKALTGGRGVDVAIEAVGGDVFKAALQSLAWEGRIVVMGFAGGKIPSIPANLLLLKNVSAMGVYCSRYQQEDFPLFSSAISSVLQYCQEGKIHPHIGAVFKLEEVTAQLLRSIDVATIQQIQGCKVEEYPGAYRLLSYFDPSSRFQGLRCKVNEAFNHVLQRKSTGKVIISMK